MTKKSKKTSQVLQSHVRAIGDSHLVWALPRELKNLLPVPVFLNRGFLK